MSTHGNIHGVKSRLYNSTTASNSKICSPRTLRRSSSAVAANRNNMARSPRSISSNATVNNVDFLEMENQILNQQQTEYNKQMIEHLENIETSIKVVQNSVDIEKDGNLLNLLENNHKHIVEWLESLKKHMEVNSPVSVKEDNMIDLLTDIKLSLTKRDKLSEITDILLDLKTNMSSNASIPLHRRESSVKKDDVVTTLNEIKTAIVDTPRSANTSVDSQQTLSALNSLSADFKNFLTIFKEASEQESNNTDTLQQQDILKEIRDLLSQSLSTSPRNLDYKAKYEQLKTHQETQFLSFSKLISGYQMYILKLCGDNEANDELQQLNDLAKSVMDI